MEEGALKNCERGETILQRIVLFLLLLYLL